MNRVVTRIYSKQTSRSMTKDNIQNRTNSVISTSLQTPSLKMIKRRYSQTQSIDQIKKKDLSLTKL
jgi:hypothetical protein